MPKTAAKRRSATLPSRSGDALFTIGGLARAAHRKRVRPRVGVHTAPELPGEVTQRTADPGASRPPVQVHVGLNIAARGTAS
jgi:hypothetical protein